MISPITFNQPIIAQCTPNGSGAIALLRLSGNNALSVANIISALPHNKKLSAQPTHTIHYGHVIDADAQQIDQVLFLVMRAPHTFTGDDTVEITCHNNPFIIQNILHAALAAGARLAQEGEFSRRAVLNNKIDMVQAEAINDLIHANTQLALKQSLSQLEGSFTQWIHSIEKQLIKALALSEASFEFLDEENMEFNLQIKEIIEQILQKSAALKITFNQQQQIRNGIRIALIGSVNAGKSSLFNALLNQERAIVTDIAGTTRDVIEAGLYKNGNYWTLIDTAGLRTTNDLIEQMGIERSREQAHKADIILLVFDGSHKLSDAENTVYQELLTAYGDKIIIINNKADLPQQDNFLTNDLAYSLKQTKTNSYSPARPELVEGYLRANMIKNSNTNNFLLRHFNANPPEYFQKKEIIKGHARRYPSTGSGRAGRKLHRFDKIYSTSMRDKNSISQVETAIQEKIATLFNAIGSPFLLNQRHFNALISLEKQLTIILEMLSEVPRYELISYHVNDTLTTLSELTGKSISEAGMDAVFREFCVGK